MSDRPVGGNNRALWVEADVKDGVWVTLITLGVQPTTRTLETVSDINGQQLVAGTKYLAVGLSPEVVSTTSGETIRSPPNSWRALCWTSPNTLLLDNQNAIGSVHVNA